MYIKTKYPPLWRGAALKETMSKRYGLPYKGSKNSIAEKIINFLPEAECFVDLFAGGCAMTHCAMESGKYKRFIINDVESDITQLFVDAVNEKYKNEDRWISRECFEMFKDTDPYIRYIWSFGNNGRDYMYGKEIEPLKAILHQLFYSKSPHEAMLIWKKFVRAWTKKPQSLESLERLQSLQSLERYADDYQSIEIPENSVIYCDIPYKETNKYNTNFDHDRFYKWAKEQKNIYISEYEMPEGFECVLEMPKRVTMMANGNNLAIEKLWVPKR